MAASRRSRPRSRACADVLRSGRSSPSTVPRDRRLGGPPIVRRWPGDDRRRLHPRPPRIRAAQPPLADRRELGGLPPPPPRGRRSSARRRLRAGHDHPRPRRRELRRVGDRHRRRPTTSSPRRRGRPTRPDAPTSRSPAATPTASTPATGRSTSSTPTRCCSTSATRSPPSPRCVGCCALAVCSPCATATTAPSCGRPTTIGSTAGCSCTTGSPNATGRRPTPAAGCRPGWRPPGSATLEVSSSTWTFADPADRDWWGRLWADRVRQSSFATQAKEYGFSDEAELDDIAEAFEAWVDAPNARVRRRPRRGARPRPG